MVQISKVNPSETNKMDLDAAERARGDNVNNVCDTLIGSELASLGRVPLPQALTFLASISINCCRKY